MPRILPSWLPRILPACALILTCVGCSPGEPAGRTNLVVIVLDTLRPDHLGCYGYDRPTSPQLDAFAAGALVFENAQSSAPWTAPSLLSLVTSLYAEAHQVQGFPNPGRMSEAATTLAERLQEHGYATAAFTEGGYAKGEFGLDQGFDLFPSNPGDEESHHSNLLHPSRLTGNIERSITWLREHADQRFFLLFHTYEPHILYQAPESEIQRFRPGYSAGAEMGILRDIVDRWNRTRMLSQEQWGRLVAHHWHCFLQELPAAQDAERLHAEIRARIEPFADGHLGYTPATLELVRDLYDAEIRYTDDQVSRLWKELAALNVEDNTIVLIVSDHGEGLGEHDLMEHGQGLYEEALRIVCLMRVPGQTPGRHRELVRSVDLMPTLLDWMEIPSEALILQGRSLAPVLAGDEPGPTYAYSGALSIPGQEASWHSLRSERWSYILDVETDRRWLFDLLADPDESVNLVDVESDVAAQMHEELMALRAGNAQLRELLGASEEIEMDDATREQLRALGYID